MAKDRFGDLVCDGCWLFFDGDAISTIGAIGQNKTYGVTDAKKFDELSFFWLCGDCAPEYPNGAKDFFVPEYFEDIPKCAECGDEEVESKGHLCDYCDSIYSTEN